MTAHGRAAPLAPDELLRYSRQILLPEIGAEGQAKLRRAGALIVGAGGLGSPAALYLAAAGIGRLGIVDADTVDASNLHRQILHGTPDLGRAKVESAADTLRRLNPRVAVDAHNVRLDAARAMDVARPYDIVIDASDNFATRYLLNDVCVLLGKPDVSGSIFRFEGQVSVFWAKQGPCYRCLYPEPPPADVVPDCGQAGVIGVVPGLIGLIQAAEAIKLIVGAGQCLVGRLLLVDALAMTFREVRIEKNPACAACGEHPTIRNPRDVAPAPCPAGQDIDPRELKARLDRGERIVLIDVREPGEFKSGHLPGALSVPLGELPRRLRELDKAACIVVYCRSGGRSARAAHLLRAAGFERVANLSGGMLAWNACGRG